MTTYVVRVWVPDRPGALGAVASRIGAVRGDLVGVDILERGAGRAIDVAWAALATSELALILGRKGRPFRARERRQLGALARIADHRWVELAQRTSRVTHPSALGR